MMTKQTKFLLAIALQIVIIFAIITIKLSVLTGGNDVLLRIVPIDPRDLFRGDYITFQYDISNIDSHYYSGQQIKNGETVYIILRQSGKYWIAQRVQKTKPTENDLFIKGKVESGGLESQTDQFSYQRFNSSRLHIVYGIEQYFIPEGKGRNFSFRNKEAAARVAVDDNGDVALKQIYVDDKPFTTVLDEGNEKINNSIASNQNINATQKQDTIINPPQIGNANEGASNNSKPILSAGLRDLPFKIGDTIDQVRTAYHTSAEPEPSDSTMPGTTALRLQSEGVWLFFDQTGKIYTIRIEAPFQGNIKGVKIGDSSEMVLKSLGEPTRKAPNMSPFIYFYMPAGLQLRFNHAGLVETIFLTK